MKVDPRISAAIPAMSSEEILSLVHNIDKIADVEVINFGSYPGPHIDLEKLEELRILCEKTLARDDIDAIVITHGTDSLEETAFYLDLTINTEKSIIVVGAMRNASELGYDGPSNLSASICCASDEKSRGIGVLVVMNNEVNTAFEVTKTHTMALDTFKSNTFGPLAIVDNDKLIFYRNATRKNSFEFDNLEKNVHLIKSAAGMDSTLIDLLIANGAKGFVIEAMGRGNIPPAMVDGVKNAISNEIPVIIVSRCQKGRVLDSYGYYGGGKMLSDLGCVFLNDLNGQKARILLMLLRNKTSDMQEIRSFLNEY